MHLAPFALLGAFFCIHAVAQRTAPEPWADEKRFGEYQDAWQVLKQWSNTTYYLFKSTFPVRTTFGGPKALCARVKTTALGQMKADLEFMYRRDNKTYAIKTEARPRKHWYKNTTNAIQLLYNGKKILFAIVIFAEGMTCQLLSFPYPYQNTKLGCELWVRDIYVDNIPRCCLFLFDYLCPTQRPYTIYNKTICNTPQTLNKHAY
ncbi:male-specific histamine-binding salivary protein-like [Amblyomma americanum]